MRVASLNSKTSSPKYVHQATREMCDTYTDGVFAVLALVNESRWDPEKKVLRDNIQYQFGRRMTTSPSNRVRPAVDVTPDCVVQIDTGRGFVAEAKLGLPKDETVWDDDINQLLKYDDDLAGWWTANERIETSDIIGLVPLARAVRFADRLENGRAAGKWRFERHICVLGFFKMSGVRDFMTLKKEGGRLSDAQLDRRLRESVPIAFERLILEYHDTKFVDHPPPMPYILQIMWDYLFALYAAEVPKEEGQDWVQLSIPLKKAVADLQSYYGFQSSGTRSPEIPRPSWVRKALDLLVQFKMADAVSEDQYLIRYKRTRGDTLNRFGRLCFRAEKKAQKGSTNQMLLLPPAGGSGGN